MSYLEQGRESDSARDVDESRCLKEKLLNLSGPCLNGHCGKDNMLTKDNILSNNMLISKFLSLL